MNLTKQEAINLHKKKWLWIANETERQQRIVLASEYFLTTGLEEPFLYSYYCEYAKECSNCPIYWEEGISCLNSYYQWSHTEDWKQAAALARKIANLSVKGDR